MKKRIIRIAKATKYVIYKETLIDSKEIFWSFAGSFAGIALIAFFQSKIISVTDNIFLIGSFGASVVLVFGQVQSPLAQPRNLVGGHLISAIIGVTIFRFLPEILWLTAPLAVSLSIITMQITKTLHPPGGATALIAVIGTEKIKSLGYVYVLSPVFTGAMLLLIVALIFNNLTNHRKYPTNSRMLNFVVRCFRK